MKPLHLLGLVFSHGAVLGVGFALGIYFLPILIAPASPTTSEIQTVARSHQFQGEFTRDLADSDALHWGEGTITIGAQSVSFSGELAPGPDYQLYLSPEFVETETDFVRLKDQMTLIGPVKTFDRFLLELPAGVDAGSYKAVIIWCETFGEFITAATYTRH